MSSESPFLTAWFSPEWTLGIQATDLENAILEPAGWAPILSDQETAPSTQVLGIQRGQAGCLLPSGPPRVVGDTHMQKDGNMAAEAGMELGALDLGQVWLS